MYLESFLNKDLLDLLRGVNLKRNMIYSKDDNYEFENDTFVTLRNGKLFSLCISDYNRKIVVNTVNGVRYIYREFVLNTETHNWMLADSFHLTLE